jgi:hypothetical protein
MRLIVAALHFAGVSLVGHLITARYPLSGQVTPSDGRKIRCLDPAEPGYTAAMTSDLLTNSPWAEPKSVDLAAVRAEADQAQHASERLRAARVIAATARDSSEARDLLAMLGLEATDIRAACGRRTAA